MRNSQVAFISLVLGTCASAQGQINPSVGASGATAHYHELTNTFRSVANFNVETTRGMAVASAGEFVFINTHGSTLNLHVPGGPLGPDFVWPTINNPVALDIWLDESDISPVEYAVVLGSGTHALVLHDLEDGRIRELLQLPAETGDVVVDADNARAFVSLPGNNTVWQVSLPELELEAIFEIASQRPRFLYLDRGDPKVADDNVVFVTPELSGNNSVSSRLFVQTEAFPVDLGQFPPGNLPDEDLFRISPAAASAGPAPTLSAEAMLRGVGTIMTAHGRHPSSGEYWLLGTDALNTLPFPQVTTEPSIKGEFQLNQLVIAPTLWDGTTPEPPTAPAPVDLDLVGGYAPEYAMSFPWALAFHEQTGAGLIAASASDQLRAVDMNGQRIGDMQLPPGSIPRDLLFAAAGNILFVYCWGTNVVRVYDANQVLTAMASDPQFITEPHEGFLVELDLGVDPTPESIRRGREIFYDGDNSANGRTTCNHCHPSGGMDLLGWNIQDFPHDHKDLMVTQSLKSIEDTFPYHWRGERDLEAFNGAFEGLLGGEQLDESPGGELEDFKMFVFSLQAHANPMQDPRRILNAALGTVQPAYNPPVGHTAGNAVSGQDLMDKPAVLFDRFSCADCHGKVAGTVGDPQIDDVGGVPANLHLDVAHFRELFHKQQDLVVVMLNDATGVPQPINMPRGGFGLTHDGEHPSVFDFLHENPFDINDQEEQDLAAFVEQADHGISPAAHMAWLVTSETSGRELRDIETILLPQAGLSFTAKHWVSLAIVGTHEDASGSTHDLRWFYYPALNAFFCDDPTVVFADGTTGSQSWQALRTAAEDGTASFTILGLPPASALRWAADRDDDGATDFDEVNTYFTDPFNPDTDGDGDPDGHEILNGGTHLDPQTLANDTTPPTWTLGRVDHTGATYAKIVVGYSEPCTVEFTTTNQVTGNSFEEKRFIPRVFDSITLQRLEPSLPAVDYPPNYPIADVQGVPYPYTVSMTMTDLSGNSSTATVFSALTTRDQLVLNPFGLEIQSNDPQMPPALLSRTIDALSWSGTPAAPDFQAEVVQSHRFQVPELAAAYTGSPNTPNGSANPLEHQVIVAQVLHFDSTTETWSVVDGSNGLTLSSSLPDRVQNTVVVRGDPSVNTPSPGAAPINIDGPFLLSTETDSAGKADFLFTVNGTILSGDKIKLNVIAIMEQDNRDGPNLPANEFWLLSAFQYNMPVTPEELRGLTWTAP